MDPTKSAHAAPGGPGMPPRWTRGAKEAVGTAYSTASRVWYTVAAGILTEVFYPTIDTPQIRDLQFLITDGATFFHDERRNTTSSIDCVDDAALGFEIVNVADEPRYILRKTLIGHPHQDCVLMRTRVEAAPDVLNRLQLYILCAPHLEIGGWHNNAEVVDTKAGPIIVAFKGSTWMALGATAPLTRRSANVSNLMPRSSSKRWAASIRPSTPSCTRSPMSIEFGIDAAMRRASASTNGRPATMRRF